MLYEILKANKTGLAADMFTYLASARLNTDMNVKEREKTGKLPMVIYSDGTSLLDWSIRGAVGGVGRLGKNYLKQIERTMPDGTYGKRVYTTASWSSARTGTFNSGQVTAIGFNFHKSDNSNLTPLNVGKMFIMEGASGDPETEGVELDIFQGGVTAKGDYDLQYWVLRYGDDGSGDNVIYENNDTNYIPIRCGTAVFRLKPDTDYSFARVGGDNDIEIQYTTAKNSADLRIDWAKISGLNSIPGNLAPEKSVEQWTVVNGYNYYNTSFSGSDALDSRPATFDYCAYYADLKAGHYKVVCECYGTKDTWKSSHIYNDITPYIALISENNAQIIPKTRIFQGAGKWHHEEYDFTLTADTKVGLYFKAVKIYGTVGAVRFGIFDYDTPNVQFTVQDGQGTLSGVTCWEPYHYEIPLTVRSGNNSTTVTIDAGTFPLSENDTIDFATAHVTVPTYSGKNIITADTETQPSEMYVKYKGTGQTR